MLTTRKLALSGGKVLTTGHGKWKKLEMLKWFVIDLAGHWDAFFALHVVQGANPWDNVCNLLKNKFKKST